MDRLSAVLLVVSAFCAGAQTVTPAVPTSDAQAEFVAKKAMMTLTRGLPLKDVTMSANVIQIYGSDIASAAATFKAKGLAKSRIDLNLTGGTRSDVRTPTGGGAWKTNTGAAKPYAGHNCQTDAAWFFPALSSLSQTANPNFIFKYVGEEQHGSVNTQHIRVFQIFNNDSAGILRRLSTEEFYLDVATGLPDAIAFKSHPDNDLNTNIDTEIRFANYQSVSGVLVPFHFQQITNGSVVLDATVTAATMNSGISDSLFNLQ